MKGYAKEVLKILFFALGFIFLIIGIAGILLPIAPGIPFLILAFLFFAAGMTGKKRKEFKKKVKREIKEKLAMLRKLLSFFLA